MPNESTYRIADFASAMDEFAPTALAQEWDNVGLLAGSLNATFEKALYCIDLTPAVAQEAVEQQVHVVMAYHPPIFKPLKRITGETTHDCFPLFQCLSHGIAVYSTHTALDAATGGTNDILAAACGMTERQPLEHVPAPGPDRFKLTVFVPHADIQGVSQAMFDAGAGVIGDYDSCSFRVEGTGSFRGNESTNPAVGKKEQFEEVGEARLEVVVPKARLAAVVDAMIVSHPYEEPAYDIYGLTPPPIRGIGRVGKLPDGSTVASVARRLRDACHAACVQFVGKAEAPVRRGIIVVGSAGRMPFQVGLGSGDVVITGEIRHHDALAFQTAGAAAIALNHWTSERPALAALMEGITKKLPGTTHIVSEADCEVFTPLE